MTDHPVKNMMRLMATKIRTIADVISDEQIDALIDEILNANRIYTMGAGRSGLVAKSFAMRLMHLGLSAFVVGETVTPAMKSGDIIVVFSGSGATKTVADISETTKEIGGRVCLVTSKKESRIGRIADCIVIIESQRDRWRRVGGVRDQADDGRAQVVCTARHHLRDDRDGLCRRHHIPAHGDHPVQTRRPPVPAREY